jgi:hypothetical protein
MWLKHAGGNKLMVDQTRQNRLRLIAERQGFTIRASRFYRTACTNQNQKRLDRPAGGSVVREDSPAFATVDEIAELLKSAAGRAKSSDLPTKARPTRLGQVSEAAAELAAQESRRESKATIGAEDVLQQCAPAPKLRTNRPLAAELAPMQPLPLRRSRTVGVSGVGILLLMAIPVGFLVMFPALWQREATDRTIDFAMFLQPVQSASVSPSGVPIPRLVVDQTGGITGEPVPLGLTIQGLADGAVVIITGLVPGMTLSTGNALGANVWQVPATDLANTWVGPPTDFVGMVDLIAELQLVDATVIHRQPIHIEWSSTGTAVAAQVPALTPAPEAVPAPRQLEQAETAMEGSEKPTARAEHHGGTAVAAQVPASTPAPEVVQAPRQLEQAETAMEGTEKPTATAEHHGGTAVAAQVPALTPVLEAVPAPQQLEQAETAMEGSEKPTARAEHHGGTAVAAQVPALTPAPEAVPAPQQLEQAETAMEGTEKPTARTEQHGGTAVAARVPALTPVPEAVPAPRQLEQAETAMEGSEKPTARTDGGRIHQKRKASARQRASDARAYVDQEHEVRQPSQPTQTRDDQDSDRVFIDAQGIVKLIQPRRRSEPNEDSLAVKQVVGLSAQFTMCPAAKTGRPAGPGARTLVPLPNWGLLAPPAEFNCELNAASPDDASGQSSSGLPPAKADAGAALRSKLDYEQQCYRHGEMILRDHLLLLQAQAGETVKAATKCAAASARSSTRLRARASIPLPAQALLAPPPEFECEKTTPTRVQTDPDTELRAKLAYERQCYRHAEMILRDRLLGLQASVGETIKAVNRGEPAAVGQPIIKQQRRSPAVGQPIVKQQGREDPKLVRSRSANPLAAQKPRRYSAFAQRPRRYPAFTVCLYGIARTKCVNILVERVGI